MNGYTPIDCDYYDRLEAWATKRTKLLLVYLADEGKEQSLSDTIIDLFVKEHVEYLRTASGKTIRLDGLVSIADATGTYTLNGQSCSTK